MRLRLSPPFAWLCAACAGVPASPRTIPLAPSGTSSVAALPAVEAPEATVEDPTTWLRVHVGSALLPVAGTTLLRDATGRHWFTVHEGEVERTTAELDPFLVPIKDPSGDQHERRLKWAVGDARGLRYAFVDGASGPCDAVAEPLFLERSEGAWRVLAFELRDPSAPLPLRSGDFDGGFVLIDSENSCGHGGRPFDYSLVTRLAPRPWPNPRRFTAPFMLGRRTFSEIAFESFAVSSRGDVVVFGLHHGVDAAGELTEFGSALEIFRSGAAASELVPVAGELGVPDAPEIVLSSDAVTLRARDNHAEITYEKGRWSARERPTTADDELFERLSAKLRAQPLLVDGAPFELSEIVRHAGLLWFSGVAGDREVTFVEGRARWKGGK